MNDVVFDFDLFISNIGLELDYLLGENFQETSQNFDSNLTQAVKNFETLLDDTKKAIDLDGISQNTINLSTFVYEFNDIYDDIAGLQSQLDTILNACGSTCPSQFVDGLNKINNALELLTSTAKFDENVLLKEVCELLSYCYCLKII